ncbi:MAG: cation:proton antiporter [Verrucomicrobia bacterium]|nr:cation:proton antiporter [Verrucomicrobiota bacterium]
MNLLVVFLVLVFAYSLLSGALERSPLTGPIFFTSCGLLLPVVFPTLPVSVGGRSFFLHVAEVGLVLLLFTDASRTNGKMLRQLGSLPVRLLSTGMLLTLALGTVLARVVFPQLSWAEAGILSAILAPTDAGLGQVIVSSLDVPTRIRQALNVEAGLNDGLSVPFLMFFLALVQEHGSEGGGLMKFMMEQLGYGAMIGAGIGGMGGMLIGWAHRRGWTAEAAQSLAVVALPLLCLLVSPHVGASMFIAAFMAGLLVQFGFPEVARHSAEFAEGWGQLLNFSVFFFFGFVVVRELGQITGAAVVYAVLSLTVIRLVPVAIALWGTRLSRPTVVFMGWFGPRGLASLVLALVYLEEETRAGGESTVRLAVMVTVLLSIFLHGISAQPGIRLYARSLAQLPASAPEHQDEVVATR